MRMHASRPILQTFEQSAALGPQPALGEWAITRKQVGTLSWRERNTLPQERRPVIVRHFAQIC